MSLRLFAKAAAILACLQLTSAGPTTNSSAVTHDSPDSGGWVKFCNDDNCQVGCGIWVSAGNPGCLKERGRGSVYIKNEPWGYNWGIVYSPDDSCSCQSECVNMDLATGCYALDNTLASSTLSYRLLTTEGGNACDDSVNNC